MKKPNRVTLSVRVTRKTRDLLDAEQRRTEQSRGRIIDRVVERELGLDGMLERYGANRPLSLIQRFRVWIGWV